MGYDDALRELLEESGSLSIFEAQDTPVRTVAGTVTDADAAPVAGVHVHAEGTDGV